MAYLKDTRLSYRNAGLHGQALAEFAIISPLVLFLGFIAFYMGAAMYAGAQASSAIKQPVLQKKLLADTPGDATGVATGIITGFRDGSFSGAGGMLDGAPRITNNGANNVTAIFTGTKTFTPPISFLPAITFNVSQGINASLLRANAGPASALGSAPVIPPYTKSTPFANGTIDPVMYGIALNNVPATIQLNSIDCSTYGYGGVDQVNARIEAKNPAFADYKLMSYWNVAPGQVPPIGTMYGQFGSNLSIPIEEFESKFVDSNIVTACNSAETQTVWEEECLIEQAGAAAAAAAAAIPPVEPGVPPAEPVPAPAPAAPDPIALAAALPGKAGTGLASSPNWVPACVAKKKYACSSQYATRYLFQVMQAMRESGGCNITQATSDTSFKQSSAYTY